MICYSMDSPNVICWQMKNIHCPDGDLHLDGLLTLSKQAHVFPCQQYIMENFTPFSSNSKFSSANSFSLEESDICRLGKGLTKRLSSFKVFWMVENDLDTL